MKKRVFATFDIIHDENVRKEKERVDGFMVSLLAQGLSDQKTFKDVTYKELDGNFFDYVGRHANPVELKNINRIVRIIRGE